MSDVSIIGLGLHPFGRTPGRSGLEQGVVAAQAALADAGLSWSDVQYAFGGSHSAGNADTMVNRLGLTGLPFINVANGCATGGSALLGAYMAIRSGQCDVAIAIGFDKHDAGAFAVNPGDWGLGNWYGEVGLALTTQFFAMKLQRYMHEYGITNDALVRVAVKAYSNGALNPNAWRRKALAYEEIAQSPMLNEPLRKYMFCSPAEGAAALVLGERGAGASSVANRSPCVPPPFARAASARSRYSVHPWHWSEHLRPRSWLRARPTNWRVSALKTSTSHNYRTRNPVPRSCIWPKTVSVSMASRNRCCAPVRQALVVACRSTRMAAASPMANPSVRPDCAKSTNCACSYVVLQVHARCQRNCALAIPTSMALLASAP